MTIRQLIAAIVLGCAWAYGVYNTVRAKKRTVAPRGRGLFVRVGWRDLTSEGRRLALHGMAGYAIFLLIGAVMAYLAR